MAGIKLSLRTLLIWHFHVMRAIAMVPFSLSSGTPQQSQVYLGVSIALQIVLTIWKSIKAYPMLKISQWSVLAVAPNAQGLAFIVLITVIRLSLITSTRTMIKLLRYLTLKSVIDPRISRSTYAFLIVNMSTMMSNIYLDTKHSKERTDIVYFRVVMNLPYFITLRVVSLGINVALQYIAADLKLQVRELIYLDEKNLAVTSTSGVLPSNLQLNKSGFIRSKLHRIRNVRMACQNIHSAFILPVFLFLVYEPLELLILILFALYAQNIQTVYGLLLFIIPGLVHLWLILDAPTDYERTCEDGVHLIRKLITEVGKEEQNRRKEVWQLRGIQAELESMPRFTIFGLFELGRHCLLSMGSLVLIYVIIVVQFAGSGTPVTCLCSGTGNPPH
ncbi:Gustatory receptor 76 [Hyalella azteca]|uniref:Gustatory receptor 76 n=1 Tax=Hyalella azteca TaxID=294128 RepID=A0A6A0GQ62_HYAAZ|nr:Gustatory receptor 76 [Hyalella azteca]